MPPTPKNMNTDYINFSELSVENSEVRWSGFISKKGEKIQCDCRQIWGPHYELPHHLNISHRMQYDEILKRKILAMFYMEASMDTEATRFNEFVEYFRDKQRIGVINIEHHNETPIQLILVPKGDIRDKIVKFNNNFLVIVSEQTANYPNYEEMMQSNFISPDQQMLSYIKNNPSLMQQLRSEFQQSPSP